MHNHNYDKHSGDLGFCLDASNEKENDSIEQLDSDLIDNFKIETSEINSNYNIRKRKEGSAFDRVYFCMRAREILHSNKFHLILVILVIIESFFVAGEVIINDIQSIVLKNNEPNNLNLTDCLKYGHINRLKHENLSDYQKFNVEKKKNFKSEQSNHDENFLLLFEIIKKICEYGSMTILSLFIVEIIAKLIFDPRCFLKLLELLDVFIVTVSFCLNLYFLTYNIQIHSITGLITLLRLWRIAQILQAISFTIKAKYKSKMRKMHKILSKLENENANLKKQLLIN